MSKKFKTIYFEPEDVIDSKEDFTKELILYKERENIDLFILREGMEPLIEIDGEKYRCILEYPTMIRTENPILKAFSFPAGALAYKIVAIHHVDEE